MHNYSYDCFKSGTRVMVVEQTKYFNHNLKGMCGTIITRYASNLGVKIDGLVNPSSDPGLFYFRYTQLIPMYTPNVIEEENNMAISNITNYFNAVKVKFIGESSTNRHVYANFDMGVEVGDLVVVKPAHHDIALARVEEILPDNTYETTREVIAKVDTTYYKERVEAREKIAKVKAQMEERAKKLQDIALYQMLAKDDPEMAQLLADYQSLPQY